MTVKSRVAAAAVTVVKPPTAFKFTVVIPLPVNVPVPVALLIVTVFKVLPVEAVVVDVSVTSTFVQATPVEINETSVADAKVTDAVVVVPIPASVQANFVTPVPNVVLATNTALVPAVPELETFTVSKPAIVTDGCSAKARAVVDTRFNVSVPEPPLILSKLVKVKLAALNVSLPAVLVVPASPLSAPEVSTPVVSDLWHGIVSC